MTRSPASQNVSRHTAIRRLLSAGWIVAGFFLFSAGVAERTEAQETTVVAEAADGPRLVRVKVRDQESNEQTIEGRVVVEAQDGGLIVELRNGEYRTIRSTDLIEKSPQAEPFRLMSADELGQNLVQTLGSGLRSTRQIIMSSARTQPKSMLSSAASCLNVSMISTSLS